MSTCTIMKYYGSKRRMISVIRSCLPHDYKVWVEGCMGSGAVSLNRDCPSTCKVNIINEKGRGMYRFWKTLADKEKGVELMELLKSCEDNRHTFYEACWNICYTPKTMSEAEYAMYVYLSVALSFNGDRKNYSNEKRKKDFGRMVENHMRPAYERFQNEQTKVLNWDVVDLMEKIVGLSEKVQKDIMVYLDPPYMPNVRSENALKIYENEMSVDDHLKLLELLQRAKCKVLLSGYLHEGMDTYCEWLIPHGYQCYFAGEYERSCSVVKIDKGIEYLWCNYELPKGAQVELYPYQSKVIWTP